MNTARKEILAAIRRHALKPVELPALDDAWTTYADPPAQFGDVLEAVGGRCVRAASISEINAELDEFAKAGQVVSLVPGIGRSTISLEKIADPHELESLEFAVLPGELAVAENGAVWVADTSLRHRVLPFIAQHLALVVSSGQVVSNLHEAYERLGELAGRPGFGVFVSGPSKTADIEQSLVIGAHGARSLTVFLLDGQSATK